MRTVLRLLLLGGLLHPALSIAQSYCQPSFVPAGALGDYIDGFQMGGINITGSGPSAVPGYANYAYTGNGRITSLTPGVTISAIITGGTDPGNDHYAIWVDVDQDFVFEPNELLAQATAVGGVAFQQTSFDVTLPANAQRGYTGMRLMCVDGLAPTDPCGAYEYGETEDYTVVIDDGAPCIPIFPYGSTDGHCIQSVQVGSISTGSTGDPATPYTDFQYAGSDAITSFMAGSTYQANIGSGSYQCVPGESEFYSAWVDLDQSGDFQANEKLASAINLDAFSTITLSLIIPPDARPGYTRMRVLCAFNADPASACEYLQVGEAEDYTVVIQAGPQCIPVFGSQGWYGDYVSGVQLADLNWSLAPGGTPQGYLPPVYGTHLPAGYSGTLTVTTGSYSGNDNVAVWLDLDGSGFGGDMIGTQVVAGPFGTATFPVSIPDHLVGYATLRVVCSYASMGVDGCTVGSGYGTTADFYVAVSNTGLPCLPLQGEGTWAGGGIVSVDLQGQAYTPVMGFPHYTFMNGNVHRFYAGASDEIGLSTATAELSAVTIALDMNDDGDFSDTDEVLGNYSVLGPLFASLDIPASCPPGQHTLRLRSSDPAQQLADLCDDNSFGNTFDILVVVEDPNGPCVPFSPLYTWVGDFIDGVQLGTIENMGTGGIYGAAYHDYAAQSADLMVGQVAPLFITGGEQGGNMYSAWIDYNNDSDFDDADESLGSIGIADPYATGLLIFNVPSGTLIGSKHMRVRCAPTALVDACATSAFGETEDYRVNITVNTGVATAASNELRLLPTTDGVQLLSDATCVGHSYLLLDATGRMLATGRITGDRTDLPMMDFARGAYTVQLLHGDARQVKRFVW